MELAAGIDQSFYLVVGAIQQKADKRIRIIKFRIRGDDDTGFGLRQRWICARVQNQPDNNHPQSEDI
jgi:hypothetical protein